MADENALIRRAAAALASVASDTHYGIHDGDYCVPYGEPRLTHTQSYPDCACILCALRRRIDSGAEACLGFEVEPGVYSGCDQSAGDCPSCGK